MEASTPGAHFAERHGAHLPLTSQYNRAASGINPTTGVVQNIPLATTHFYSSRVQLNAINRAEQIFINNPGKPSLAQVPQTFRSPIGQGYDRALKYGEQYSAQAWLNSSGKARTAYPIFGE